jgi:multisubunit Na+/H+ antiporter MnhB subunit
MKKNKIISIITAIVMTTFGLLTLYLSSSILFDWFGVRAKQGNYVFFIVGTNFLCSILYLTVAYGLYKRKEWTFKLLLMALILLSIGFIGLLIHINMGGLYETKTVGAMFFRIVLTIGFIGITKKLSKK